MALSAADIRRMQLQLSRALDAALRPPKLNGNGKAGRRNGKSEPLAARQRLPVTHDRPPGCELITKACRRCGDAFTRLTEPRYLHRFRFCNECRERTVIEPYSLNL